MFGCHCDVNNMNPRICPKTDGLPSMRRETRCIGQACIFLESMEGSESEDLLDRLVTFDESSVLMSEFLPHEGSTDYDNPWSHSPCNPCKLVDFPSNNS